MSMLYNIMVLIIGFIISFMIIKVNYKTNFSLKNKVILFEILFLFVGFSSRLLCIQNFPSGLNVDEASSGYEAYSILNYGFDRHGNSFPIFLESWGGGQNALYSYILIPFIKVMGLNLISIRLPMAIIGCISLYIFYKLLKKFNNDALTHIGLFFLAICPWHIMKSRWGLESNIFPDMILWMVYLIISFLKNGKKFLLYLSFCIAGLSFYAYGTSYFFVPVFVVFLLFILLKKKKITVYDLFISILILVVVALPVIVCVFINKFNLPTIKIGLITIPSLSIIRYNHISSIFSSNFVASSINNLLNSVFLFISQYDYLNWNALYFFGIIYIPSIIFFSIGIYISLKNKLNKDYNWIFSIWLLCSFLLSIVCKPNINRLNVMWFPVIYYTIIGIYLFINHLKKIKKILCYLYTLLFALFMYEYFTFSNINMFTFNSDLGDAIKFVSKIEKNKKVYVSNSIKEPYIYFLFYKKYNTSNFINSVKYKKCYKCQFQEVLSFGNYYFIKIDKIEKPGIYIIEGEELEKNKYLVNNLMKKKINKYYVIIK